MKKYLDFIGENKNTNDIISDIKDILLEITDLNLKVNYKYFNNHINVLSTDIFNKFSISINSDIYDEPFRINDVIIDTLYRLDDFLKMNNIQLYLSFDIYQEREYRINSILNFRNKYLRHIYLIIDFRLNENLNLLKSSDFKNRWGIESDLKVDGVYKYFDFFRDSLIDLEDDGLISRYRLQYFEKGVMSAVSKIDVKTDDIQLKIGEFTKSIKEKASLIGDLNGSLSIATDLYFPEVDITDKMSLTIDCVKFLKDNGVDMGFECHFLQTSSQGVYKIILNTEFKIRKAG
jgi:hypothetical protein